MAADVLCPTDKICDPGTCHALGCRSGSPGGGGCVEDLDCEYGYLVRDVPLASMGSNMPHQDCWDFCSLYLTNEDKGRSHGGVASKCKARKILANGGQLFCGYVGGNSVSDRTSWPYRNRCHVFVFPSDATKFDHHDQEIIGPMNAAKQPYTGGSPFPTSFGDGAASRSGPYEKFYMSQDPCDTDIDLEQMCVESAELECRVDGTMGAEICVKSPSQSEELCAGSDVTLAEAQSECSALADTKLHVLVNWGGPVKATSDNRCAGTLDCISENLHCPPHSEGTPDLYICAVHQAGHTWMVGYTIATHDATPVRHSGRYHLHKRSQLIRPRSVPHGIAPETSTTVIQRSTQSRNSPSSER